MMISYIGIGSNLGDSKNLIRSALQNLDAHPFVTLKAYSHLYQSKPHGPQDQPDYLNAVAKIDTQLPPLQLLDTLQSIENVHGRLRKEHWGARTLDLDILTYEGKNVASERLSIPHPFMMQRPFVIHPMYEISPDFIFDDGQSLAKLATLLPTDELSKLEHINVL